RRELERLIGCFMNFLPIRLTFSGNESAQELLASVKATVLEAQAHQDCPFEKIVEAVNPERSLNGNPLYNVALLFQNFPPLRLDGLQATPMPAETKAALLDLRFEAEQTQTGFAVVCEYRRDLFEESTIENLLGSFTQAIDLLMGDPQAKLSQ